MFTTTRLQLNYLATLIALFILQAYFLWDLNGNVTDFIEKTDVERVALFFAPTGGMIWCMKHLVVRGAETDVGMTAPAHQ